MSKRILELKCCLGSGIFTDAVKLGVAPHTRKQRVLQQFQNYAPPSLRVIRTKFARTECLARSPIIYPRFSIEQT